MEGPNHATSSRMLAARSFQMYDFRGVARSKCDCADHVVRSDARVGICTGF